MPETLLNLPFITDFVWPIGRVNGKLAVIWKTLSMAEQSTFILIAVFDDAASQREKTTTK